jgi:membrane-anchored protein YejM (alkaline phosphatase superfamily)
VHLAKASARPVVNAFSVGTATPVVSAAEDVGSVGVSVLALLVPILVLVVLPLVVWAVWLIVRARLRRRRRLADSA